MNEIRVTSVGGVEVCWGVLGRRWGGVGVGLGRWVGVECVRGACVGRACLAISVGIARSALLSGYLGKSGHLPRYARTK